MPMGNPNMGAMAGAGGGSGAGDKELLDVMKEIRDLLKENNDRNERQTGLVGHREPSVRGAETSKTKPTATKVSVQVRAKQVADVPGAGGTTGAVNATVTTGNSR